MAHVPETPAELREALNGTRMITNDTKRALDMERIKIAALINIGEVLLAIYGGTDGPDDEPDHDPEAEPDPSVSAAPIIGRTVRVKGGREDEPSGVIVTLGESEGEAYAVVEFDDGESKRVWLDNLELVDARDLMPELSFDEAVAEGLEAAGFHEDAAEMRTELADQVDDIDADFTGEVKPLTKAERKALKAKAGGE